ncbi:MAG TPA: amino acid permease [Thermoleophilaceae bacterium]|nr:amino acid permease [Thermoleophilaceae bacterium]
MNAESRIAKGLGQPALFAIGVSAVASSIYYVLGIVAGQAQGLTPLVFAVGALFFVLTMLTYVEGNALHPERGGAAVLARYAFNELWSFVAGWAILLDFLIVLAIGAVAVPHYLGAFWAEADDGAVGVLISAATIAWVAWVNYQGVSAQRFKVVLRLSLIGLVVFAAIVVIGAIQLFDLSLIVDSIDLGTLPRVDDLVFAMVIATVACTGIEAASGLAADVKLRGSQLRRVAVAGAAAALVLYVAVSVIALMAVPVGSDGTELGKAYLDAPVLGVVSAFEPSGLAEASRYVVGIVGALVLVQAVNGQMLGIGRLAYSLGTHRQIPSILSRLDGRRSTPYVTIVLASVIAFGLVLTGDIDFLAGIFAFGAMMAFTLAHLSVIVLRFREPDRARPFRIPLNVSVGGGSIPIPAALGALMGAAGWLTVVVLHEGARIAGGIWMLAGLALYVAYRRSQGKELTKRFTIPEEALKEAKAVEYGSILVPVFGTALDDDIVGTAGRLASDEAEEGEGGAMLEAVYVFELPMSLPIDARVAPDKVAAGRKALARAKEVGEEYEGVEVATATVRGRSAGAAIVSEAKRRGVEAIVLAAEPPSRVRGGAVFGGKASVEDRFAGNTTRYVVEKAPCKVILTAAPADAPAPEPEAAQTAG